MSVIFRMLGHNGLSGIIPDGIGALSKLQFLMINYNQLNGQFPSVMASAPLGYCYATPNQFQTCPDASIANNTNSLAFQCNIDCVLSYSRPSAAETLHINPLFYLAAAVLAWIFVH